MGRRSGAPPRTSREIGLCNVSFPHSLIQSSRDLVDLHLGLNPCDDAGSLSAEALAAALSETHRLERLSISPYPIKPNYPDQRRTAPPASPTNTRVFLCGLARFDFAGFGEYLEDLVSRIDAPILKQLEVSSMFPNYPSSFPEQTT